MCRDGGDGTAPVVMDRTAWNERWSTAEWDRFREPNDVIVTQVTGMTPGVALDLGCGIGRHAVWLATQGWRAIGVDFSEVALEKGRALAAERGVDVTWVNADLYEYEPAPDSLDLVVITYVHPPPEQRARLLRAVARSLRPGGTFMILGYDRVHDHGRGSQLRDPARLLSVDDLARELDGLRVVKAFRFSRVVDSPDGERTIAEILIRAERTEGMGLAPGAGEHPNAVLYRRTAGAFRERDMETLETLIDPDVVWHVPGANPLAGDVRGWDALVDWFDRLRTVTGGTFTLEEHDVLGTDGHVVALSLMCAQREGAGISVRVVSVFHYRRGRQSERWFHPTDMAAWDRMLGG